MLPNDGTQRASFDNCNPNTLADALKLIGLGALLQGQIPQVRRNQNPVAAAANPYELSTLDVITLPDGGKASVILRATVRTATTVPSTIKGESVVEPVGTTPSTKQVAVTPAGNIAFLGTDAVTNVDIVYIPERGDVVNSVYPVASNAVALPSALTTRGVILIEECESLEGTYVGPLVVLMPGASPSAGQVALDVAKANVAFAAADAVTRVRLKLLVAASQDLCTVLEGAAQTL